jgi:hypothetical protein
MLDLLNKKMIKELHIASQYLAAAGISFVEKKPDDSHTNLGWDSENGRLTSHSLNAEGVQLGLAYEEFALVFLKADKELSKLPLLNQNHGQVMDWINAQLSSVDLTTAYNYDFHYDTGYEKITNEYVFTHYSKSEVEDVIKRLTIGQSTFERFLTTNELESPIRVWPHHFDLGIYTLISENLFMGAGLAIPDSIYADFYFYASGYLNGESMGRNGFVELNSGNWGQGDFNGAVLNNSGVKADQAFVFFNEAKNGFLEKVTS